MKTTKRTLKLPPLTAVIEPGADGFFVATCPELDVVSQGKTRKQSEIKVGQAVALFLESASEREIERRLAQRKVVVKRLQLASSLPVHSEFDRKSEQELSFRAYSILHWQDSAHKLAYAATVLFNQYQSVWVAPFKENKRPRDPDCFYSSLIPVIVLYSYAIENLAKGILIARGAPALENGKFTEKLTSHKLRAFIDSTGVPLQERQRKLVEQLEQAAQSLKYPIPLTPDRMSAHQETRLLREEDVGGIKDLFDRFDEELRSVSVGETGPTLEAVLRRIQPPAQN